MKKKSENEKHKENADKAKSMADAKWSRERNRRREKFKRIFLPSSFLSSPSMFWCHL